MSTISVELTDEDLRNILFWFDETDWKGLERTDHVTQNKILVARDVLLLDEVHTDAKN